MRILSLLIFCIHVSFSSIGQLQGFYNADNTFHELYKNAKVKSLTMQSSYANKKTLFGYVDGSEYNDVLIQEFDRQGNIIKEKEFYVNDSTDGKQSKYSYNENNQLVKTEWLWFQDKVQELAEYEYNFEGKLVKQCNYIMKPVDKDFELNMCWLYYYGDDHIQKVVNSEGDVRYTYKKEGDIISMYSADGELRHKYDNGMLIYQKLNSKNYEYHRDENGRIIKTIVTDNNKNVISITSFEHSNGLLVKIINRDESGRIEYEENYEYEYYK